MNAPKRFVGMLWVLLGVAMVGYDIGALLLGNPVPQYWYVTWMIALAFFYLGLARVWGAAMAAKVLLGCAAAVLFYELPMLLFMFDPQLSLRYALHVLAAVVAASTLSERLWVAASS